MLCRQLSLALMICLLSGESSESSAQAPVNCKRGCYDLTTSEEYGTIYCYGYDDVWGDDMFSPNPTGGKIEVQTGVFITEYKYKDCSEVCSNFFTGYRRQKAGDSMDAVLVEQQVCKKTKDTSSTN